MKVVDNFKNIFCDDVFVTFTPNDNICHLSFYSVDDYYTPIKAKPQVRHVVTITMLMDVLEKSGLSLNKDKFSAITEEQLKKMYNSNPFTT